jgi:hypothetical protein
MPDGRVAVLDCGVCGEIDDGLLATMGVILRNPVVGTDEEIEAGAREHGFLMGDRAIDRALVRELMQPL